MRRLRSPSRRRLSPSCAPLSRYVVLEWYRYAKQEANTSQGKGKAEKTEKAEEKTDETPAVPALPEAEAKAAEPATEEAAKPVEVEATAAKPATTEEELPAKPLEATPAVTAAA